MATQSIFRNIVIEEPHTAELLVTALEKASKVSNTHSSPNVECETLRGKDITKFLETFIE